MSISENAWGMFSWGDAPPAIGGGIGAFQWFDTRESLLCFIAESAVLMWKDFESQDDYENLRDSLRSAVQQTSENDKVLEKVNCMTRGLFQVEWIGQFHELATSQDDFPKKVRAHFYDNRNDQVDAPESIEDKELTSFAEALEEYGL